MTINMLSRSTLLLLAIGAILSHVTMAFSPSFLSTANSHRGSKLHFYLGEDGYGGFPGEFPMDQYAPSPIDQYASSALEFEAVVYDRAMDCANNPGMCDLDELMDLARGETSLLRVSGIYEVISREL